MCIAVCSPKRAVEEADWILGEMTTTEYEALEEAGISGGRGCNSVANSLKLAMPPRGKPVPDPSRRKKAKVLDLEGTARDPPRKGQLTTKPPSAGARPPTARARHLLAGDFGSHAPSTAHPPSRHPPHPATLGHASRGEEPQDLKTLQRSSSQKRKREPPSGDHSCARATEPERRIDREPPQSRGTSQATSSSSGSSSASPTGSSSAESLVRGVEEQMEEGELGSTPRGGLEVPVIQYCDAFDSLFGANEGQVHFYLCSPLFVCCSLPTNVFCSSDVAKVGAQTGDAGDALPKVQGLGGEKAPPGLEVQVHRGCDEAASYSSTQLPSYAVPLIDDDDAAAQIRRLTEGHVNKYMARFRDTRDVGEFSQLLKDRLGTAVNLYFQVPLWLLPSSTQYLLYNHLLTLGILHAPCRPLPSLTSLGMKPPES